MKSLRRRLVRQASLSGLDPCLSSATPSVEEEKEWTDAATTALPDAVSWSSQIDLLDSQLGDDILDLNCGKDDDIVSDFLISKENNDVNILAGRASAAQRVAPAASFGESGTPAPLPFTLNITDVYKHAAARMEVPWPANMSETKSR